MTGTAIDDALARLSELEPEAFPAPWDAADQSWRFHAPSLRFAVALRNFAPVLIEHARTTGESATNIAHTLIEIADRMGRLAHALVAANREIADQRAQIELLIEERDRHYLRANIAEDRARRAEASQSSSGGAG